MKNIIRLFLITAVIAPLVSCKDKSCYYYEQEYNSKTKQCECVQYLNSADAPALKHNDYNSILAINQNFYYASVDNRDYPYYSHEGDTIMFYGNVGRIEYSYPDSLWVRLTFFDTSRGNGVGRILEAECLTSQLEGIDMSARCYATGVLTFDFCSAHVAWPIASIEPGHCGSRGFFFNIEDIHN